MVKGLDIYILPLTLND